MMDGLLDRQVISGAWKEKEESENDRQCLWRRGGNSGKRQGKLKGLKPDVLSS